VDGWHIEEICNHCEAVSRGVFRDLLVNVPPGTSKSKIISVCWHPWEWTFKPETRWLFVAYLPNLATRDARAAKTLIESKWYQERWPVTIKEGGDSEYENDRGGWRSSTSVRGGITGKHPHRKVVDDPLAARNTQGTAAVLRTELDYVNHVFWDGIMPTRAADPKTVTNTIVMQRLHEADLSGHVLGKGGWVHLMLPERFEPERACKTPIGGDRRTEDGELLCPARRGENEVKKLEAELGTQADGQLQQRPGRAGGQIFRAAWFRFWDELPEFDELLCSWDMTFKDTLGSDFVCGQIWGRKGADYYLIDQVYDRLNFPNTLTAFLAQLRRYPTCGAKLIEDKANGPAVISTLERKIPGLIPRTPEGGKIARANGVSYLHRSGNVLYPNPKTPGFEWVREHMRSMQGFPLASHDDDVDAETQALTYFEENKNTLLDALAALRREEEARGNYAAA
jgi:predicted phage terminase large subunit-like protein